MDSRDALLIVYGVAVGFLLRELWRDLRADVVNAAASHVFDELERRADAGRGVPQPQG